MDIATERNGGRKENDYRNHDHNHDYRDYRDHDPHHVRHLDHGRAKADKPDPSSLNLADQDEEVIEVHTTKRFS